jgi:competence protein ComEA
MPLSRQQLLAYGAVALVVLALGGRWLAGHGGSGARPAGASAAARPAPGVAVRTTSRRAVVQVAGAVRHPGVYELAAGDRVQDAVRRAGGPAKRGDVDAINLAAPVQDGTRIVVPEKAPAGAAPAATAGADAAVAPAAPIDLNSATEEQLETLDGVGPATAAKILAYRQEHGGFRSVDDLGQVPGIGPKKLAALRDHVST